jgi:ankyrin repeat protein
MSLQQKQQRIEELEEENQQQRVRIQQLEQQVQGHDQQMQDQVEQHQQQMQQQEHLLQDAHQRIDQLQQQQQEESESDHDSDDDESDAEEFDPLVMIHAMEDACQDGDIDAIINYLDGGMSVNCITSIEDWTPIMWALPYAQLAAAKLLFERGADLSRTGNDGSDILHLASMGGDVDCVNWVLENTPIDVNSIDGMV